MPPTPTDTRLAELDVEIAVAFIALGGARQRHRRCPSVENEERITDATAEVDRLLDVRLVLRPAMP